MNTDKGKESFFDKFFAKFEKIFMGPMTKLAQQRHLMAIRDGMVSTIPLTIVGSLFLIIALPPVKPEWYETVALLQFIRANVGMIMIPFRVTVGLIAIYATYNIGYSLAKSYELDGKSGGTLALMAFLMTTLPQMASVVMGSFQTVMLADGTEVSMITAESLKALGWSLPMDRVGGAGLFVGILSAILAVEIYKVFVKKNLVIKMPDGVPDSVAKSFSALFPAFAVAFVMFGFAIIEQIWPAIGLHNIFQTIFNPLKGAIDHPLGIVLIVLFITLLWTAGIHGVSIIGTIARPMWTDMIYENGLAHADGVPLPYIAPEPFLQWFVWIGGSGGTLGLVIWLIFARSLYLRNLGKVVLIPGIFNINEPVIFGLPIMLNPFFFVPFVLGPIIVTLFTYAVIKVGLVSAPYMTAPWTFPGPIGAFFATGDIKASVLNIINIVILAAIYFPFFKAYDRKMYREEQLAN